MYNEKCHKLIPTVEDGMRDDLLGMTYDLRYHIVLTKRVHLLSSWYPLLVRENIFRTLVFNYVLEKLINEVFYVCDTNSFIIKYIYFVWLFECFDWNYRLLVLDILLK